MTQKLTDEQRKQLEALKDMPDDAIDYSDIPPLTNEFFAHAVQNPFYKPTKQAVTIRLDSDVVAWFKLQGGKYQSNINQVLREHMKEHVIVDLTDQT
jgi:uncharacterized protein (DUF4415 family)